MSDRPSNQPFALVRNKTTGVDFWEVWDERLPFGTDDYSIVAVVHGFWFVVGSDGDWKGPFRLREQAIIPAKELARAA